VSDNASSSRHISVFAAWAFAFGTAVGWGSFVMPGVVFLPLSGPLGMVLGVVAGGAVMAVIAWNYHYLVCRMPSAGGTFTYVLRTFGGDHGFFCAWFLYLSYVAIIWANATALTIVARGLFGDALRFGFHYTIEGFDVSLGDILLSSSAIVVASAICCRRRVADGVQTTLAAVFATGFVVSFVACLFCHDGGLQSMAPAFSPHGEKPLTQVLKIVALAPWLFVGFESICHLSREFSFPLKRTFGVMVAAIVASVVAYACVALLPVLSPVAGGANWVDGLARLGAADGASPPATFAVVRAVFGKAGLALFAAIAVGAVFTNLVGNMFVASRLTGAMSDVGVLPKWLGHRDGDGEPVNAIVFLAGVSCLVPLLGRTAIGFIVDVATVGSVIAYAYASAAAFRKAHAVRDRLTEVTGACGLVLSVAICALFIIPNYFSGAMMATESYLILVLWCILGFLYYLYVLKHDRHEHYGRSLVVWIGLIVLILVMSHMWMRQGMYDAMTKTFDSIGRFLTDAPNIDSEVLDDLWSEHLSHQLANANSALVRGGLTQVCLMAVTLAIMFTLFTIVRRRERRLEKEKAMAKSYFFSTVSHDIRTPLNAIIGFSEMLKAGMETKPEREQALDSILVSSKTLLGLVNDVLDLSKLESGKMKISAEPTDCSLLMRGLIDAFRASGCRPEVELRYVERPMPLLMLDPQRIRQIVFNLVGNAVKFTERGHVELRATYDRTAGGDTGLFRIDVEDTGCGIGEDDLKRIGAAYVQVDSKMSRNGGTGLGLAICRQLAFAMGGRMDIESELGSGSTFSIVIPDVRVAKSVSPALASAAAANPSPAAGAALRLGERELPHRVLLVDDSKMNLLVLKAILKKMGDFEVETALDGNEALKLLTSPDAQKFDLVLTDMWMPNLDGEGLVKAIRGNPALSSIPVLAVTADVEVRDKSSEKGFDGILLKPITPATLEKALLETSRRLKTP